MESLIEEISVSINHYCKDAHISINQLTYSYGQIPFSNPKQLAFWIGNALNADEKYKLQLLKSKSIIERLELCKIICQSASIRAYKKSRIQSLAIFIIIVIG
ncbi:unnamed protein product, partial [marine sediment metagenome]